MVILSKRNIAIFFTLTAFIVGYFFGGATSSGLYREDIETENVELASTVSIIINTDKGFAEVFSNVSFDSGESLFLVMDRLAKDKKINFDYKDYGNEMGVFINSIASSTNTKDKWWQYFVNGKYANSGISSYKPNSGDVIEFRLTGEIKENF